MPGVTSKLELRRRMRSLRDAIPRDKLLQWSDAIRDRVLMIPQITGAASVFCYVSFRSEVETHRLIRDLLAMDKCISVPRIIDGGVMIADRITSLDELHPGPYGVPARRGRPRPITAVDVVIAPGLAFTTAGDRLGYGAGHYDRWLSQHPGALSVGLGFDSQIVAMIPCEAHDQRMDHVITPEKILPGS
jgi:5-formyltetrahydrofolate cyclo-ligase